MHTIKYTATTSLNCMTVVEVNISVIDSYTCKQYDDVPAASSSSVPATSILTLAGVIAG